MSGPTFEERHPEDDPSVLSHKYRCVLRLDSGGMAEVFLAVSQGVVGFNKLFVLKRLREALADDAQHRDMFLHEARLAARLNHPNVVQTYEVSEDGSGIYIVMEYLEGQPLSRLRREMIKRELGETEASHALHVRVVSEVLAGLHYAHELADFDGTPLKIVHRDVSPQNVFVTYDGQVKIVDFGIAKTHDSGTQAGIFKGKFAYTAPEQLRGEAIDRRVDVFTAGIVLWEGLTGHRLLAADNPHQTFARLLNEPIPTVRSVAPNVDERLEAIVMRALSKRPEDRYPTAQAMRDALEEYLIESKQVVRQDRIAALMNDLFRSERARVQNVIKEELAGLAQSSSCSRVVAAPRLSGTEGSVSLPSLHRSIDGMRPALGGSATDDPQVEIVRASGAATTPRTVGYVAAGVVAIAAIAYGATHRTRSASPAEAAPPPLPSIVVVQAPAPPPPLPTATASETVAPTATEPAKPTPKWTPHPKKTSAPSAAPSAPAAVATPTPQPAPPPASAEPTAKEKRKFRTDF